MPVLPSQPGPQPPAPHLIHPLMALCERSIVLTEAERSAIGQVPIHVETVIPGSAHTWAGDRPSHSIAVLDGLLATSKTLRHGQVQITALHLAGDLPDLMSLYLEVMDSDITALTACQLAFLPHVELRRLCSEQPRVAAVLWRSVLVDAAIAREWIVSMGRRQGISRLAHLFCELVARSQAVGLGHEGTFALGLTQQDLSEVMGFSVVHLSRTLQTLRASGVVSFAQGTLTVHDWSGLARLGDFQPDYLHLQEDASVG